MGCSSWDSWITSEQRKSTAEDTSLLQIVRLLGSAEETQGRRPAVTLSYLETAGSTLRETSHLTSAPSFDCPTKIPASNTTVFLENESVKK